MPPDDEDEQLDPAAVENWTPAQDPGPLAESANIADLIDENGNIK